MSYFSHFATINTLLPHPYSSSEREVLLSKPHYCFGCSIGRSIFFGELPSTFLQSHRLKKYHKLKMKGDLQLPTPNFVTMQFAHPDLLPLAPNLFYWVTWTATFSSSLLLSRCCRFQTSKSDFGSSSSTRQISEPSKVDGFCSGGNAVFGSARRLESDFVGVFHRCKYSTTIAWMSASEINCDSFTESTKSCESSGSVHYSDSDSTN